MTSLKLDKNNNIIFQNNFLTISDQDAIMQDVKNLLLMFQTEYPFDLTMGIPWYELATYNNYNVIKNTIKERILEDNRIQSVNNLNVFFENGKMQISAELITDLGVINV
ncbi:hypothetical protein [Campylobacter jejuni]|uniref:hypothetical protein n=1 Tax=Campylobacter jejuni TaxID=197 RepID=UPI00313C634D